MNEHNFSHQKQQYVQTRSADRPPSGTYRPITLADVQSSARESTKAPSELWSQLAGRSQNVWLSAPLLVLLSVFGQGTEILAPLVLICLFGALLYRMDEASRKLAVVPLSFGAFRLIMNVSTILVADVHPGQSISGGNTLSWETCMGMPWVPALLAAGLLYAPIKEAVTTRIMYWESIIMFISGLIPGPGCIGVLCVIHYTLFIAVIVGLVIDFQRNRWWNLNSESVFS